MYEYDALKKHNTPINLCVLHIVFLTRVHTKSPLQSEDMRDGLYVPIHLFYDDGSVKGKIWKTALFL